MKSGPKSNTLTIPDIDIGLKERLKFRAAENGRSMEAEARQILQTALLPTRATTGKSFYDRIRARFARLDGVQLDLSSRDFPREPPIFD